MSIINQGHVIIMEHLSKKKKRTKFGIFLDYALLLHFLNVKIHATFPPLDLVKFYLSLPFPPFEIHFYPLSSTGNIVNISLE